MDIAAFIWLFRANPAVDWTFIVGSDKLADYGRKDERALVAETLRAPRVNARVLYIPRLGSALDVNQEIAPYPWLKSLWRAGMFVEARVGTTNVSGEALRRAIGRGQRHVNGIELAESTHTAVLEYIHRNASVLESYRRRK